MNNIGSTQVYRSSGRVDPTPRYKATYTTIWSLTARIKCSCNFSFVVNRFVTKHVISEWFYRQTTNPV